MSVPKPVETFYERIWNDGGLEAISDLLTEDFKLRGSLGMELQGRAAFRITCFRCALHSPIIAARSWPVSLRARMRSPKCASPALMSVRFGALRLQASRSTGLWVLGDLAGIDAVLKINRDTAP